MADITEKTTETAQGARKRPPISLHEIREKLREASDVEASKLAAEVINFILDKDPSIGVAGRAMYLVEGILNETFRLHTPVSSCLGEEDGLKRALYLLSIGD